MLEKSLKTLAIELCMNGENCSKSILIAGGIKYELDLTKETINCCNGISSGFGFGGMCSAIVGAVMLLGLLYDDDIAKQKSLVLFYMLQDKMGCFDCCSIAGAENCYSLIAIIADCLEQIIDE